MKEIEPQGDFFPEMPKGEDLSKSEKNREYWAKVIKKHKTLDEMKKKDDPGEQFSRIAEEVRETDPENNENWINIKDYYKHMNNDKK